MSIFGSLSMCSHVSMVTVCLQGDFIPQHLVRGNQLKVQELLEAELSASLLWPFPSHLARSILFCLPFFRLQSVHRFLPKRNPKPPFSRLTAWSPPAMEVRTSFFFPPFSPCLLSWRCQAGSGLARASLWALCRCFCCPCERPPLSEPVSC